MSSAALKRGDRLGTACFGAIAIPIGLALYASCRGAHLLSRSKRSAEARSLWLCRGLLRLMLRGVFWLRFENKPTTEDWEALGIPTAEEGGAMIMINHTSNFDGFLFAALASPDIICRSKSLMVGRAFRMPVLGTLFRLLGHEPVHFLRDEVDGSFSVDKERQKPVMERVNMHLKGGGVLCFCPEGAINRKDPTTCQPLRRGSFQMAIDLGLPIYGVALFGTHGFWPAYASPGKRATVCCRLYAVGSWNDKLRAGKTAGVTTVELADTCQAAMQEAVDSVVATHRAL
mmetsp:Transcript_26499/g.79465  ORF Transcript_26499/g.79465 Transcript_26499/m.79465 type:complete len:287 (+) Transcript_26499:220-1080(+)